MRSRASRALGVAVLIFVGSTLWPAAGPGVDGLAQTPLEAWAKQQISERTGIDPRLLATLFVTDGPDQLMLAFVYITQEVLDSNLKPEIKRAIAPYVGRKALLALVVPTRPSRFSPLEISFAQDGLVYPLSAAQVHPITEDFRAGRLEANAVSAGVVELPPGLDVQRPFEIAYRGAFRTTLALAPATPAPTPPATVGIGAIPLPLLWLLQLLLFFFLFPFLLGI